MSKIIKQKLKKILPPILALAMVIAVSSHALIYQAMAIQWQKIFQESRQWQIASDTITVDATSNNAGANATSLDLTHTLAADANAIIVTVQVVDSTTAERQISTVQWDATGTPESFINAGVDKDDASSFRTEIWYLVNPIATGTKTIRVTPGGKCTDLSAGAISLKGVDTASPIDATQTGNSQNTPPSISITTVTAGAYAIDSLVTDEADGTKIGAFHSPIHVTDVVSDVTGSQYVDAGDAGGQTMNYTDTDSDTSWIMSAVAIKPGAVTPSAPVVSAVSLGTVPSGADGEINLVEGIDTEIVVSATVTDDTCAEISGAKAYVFPSSGSWVYGTETTCSFDWNDCYVPEHENFGNGVSCSQTSCTSGTAKYTCKADDGNGMWYHASPTGTGASYSAEYWFAMVIASDSGGLDSWATNSAGGMDVMLLSALNPSSSIAYAETAPGNDSAIVETGVENTGNRGINFTLNVANDSGAELEIAGGGAVIATGQQQYSLNTFTVGAGTSLSETATEVDAVLPKPETHDDGANDDQLFWGIGLPPTTQPGTYSGTTTITATYD